MYQIQASLVVAQEIILSHVHDCICIIRRKPFFTENTFLLIWHKIYEQNHTPQTERLAEYRGVNKRTHIATTEYVNLFSDGFRWPYSARTPPHTTVSRETNVRELKRDTE